MTRQSPRLLGLGISDPHGRPPLQAAPRRTPVALFSGIVPVHVAGERAPSRRSPGLHVSAIRVRCAWLVSPLLAPPTLCVRVVCVRRAFSRVVYGRDVSRRR